jgi:hypothetical protein
MSQIYSRPQFSLPQLYALKTQQAMASAPTDCPPGLSAEGLLIWCQNQLNDLDGQIHSIQGQAETNAKAKATLNDLMNKIKDAKNHVGGDDHLADLGDQGMRDINAAIDTLEGTNPELKDSLESFRNVLKFGGDTKVSSDECDSMFTQLQNAASSVDSGNELTMINLQSLISKRQTFIQLTTNMTQAVDEGPKTIAGNIGH